MSEAYIVRRGGGGGAISNAFAVIAVTYPAGSTCTCTNGTKTLKAKDTSGSYLFMIPEAGTWTVTATLGAETASASFNIAQQYQAENVEISFVRIYGISRNITAASPAWARTDDAVGMAATASVGTTAGASDFDTCYPWAEIQRETLSTGDVMVKIPRFWYQRYRVGDIEYIKIADKATTGFSLHPAFSHGGMESDIYIGAYKTSEGDKSVSGVIPLRSKTRDGMRTGAKDKGAGWGILDISALSAIQMLILVEFADNDVQSKIGRGYCDGGTKAINTGSCDSVPSLTGRPAGTDGKVDVVWRGIEGFWGNVWEHTDGLNYNGGNYYVCNDPSKYADNTQDGYEQLSFTGQTNWSRAFITKEGLDSGKNSHIMLPEEAGSGSDSTYECDACWSGTGWKVFRHGGDFSSASYDGLFAAGLSGVSTASGSGAGAGASASIGSRLLFIPPQT